MISEDLLKLLFALLIGGVVGAEREYSSKPAGFRTMILICMGSTLFTLISMKIGGANNADRVAANIITGIGFIGAGVMFKDGFTVSGLTTAACISVTAALGMAVGIAENQLALFGTVVVIVVLSVFEFLQNIIDNVHQKRNFKISFSKEKYKATDIETKLQELKLTYFIKSELKIKSEITMYLEVYGSKNKITNFNRFLISSDLIDAVEG
ncbi:MAG: MgtC/SapB family protein [Bacteroidota bacterium]|nr:MgtC/SapB family protein [Bacteroidota bacterium]